MLGLAKTCMKLKLSFYEFLGDQRLSECFPSFASAKLTKNSPIEGACLRTIGGEIAIQI